MTRWCLQSRPANRRAGIKHPVLAPAFTVGRARDNDLRLTNRRVSKHHAVLETEDADLFIRDLNSTNGTFLNGESFQGEQQLLHNDVVCFADREYRVIDLQAESTDDEKSWHSGKSHIRIGS